MDGVLDLTNVRSTDQLHDLLASFFGFPDYYGRNWDAFDECIADFAPAGSLTLRGFQKLRSVLPRDADLLKQCLDDLAAEGPDISVVYE